MRTIRLVCICLLSAAAAFSQSGSLDLTLGKTGLSFGNGQDMTGIRFAWRDGHFNRVNGLNLSAWVPYDTVSGEVNGVAFGIIGPAAQQMHGLSIGLVGVLANRSMEGINLGGLGLVSQGVMTGVNFGGLGLVAQGTVTGINIAGLGVVSQGSIAGINTAGLGLVGQQKMRGINIGGLGTVAQGDISGLNIGGLGLVTQGDLAGCSVAGLGVVSQGAIRGVTIAGLGLVGQGGITGINLAGVGCVAKEEITGVSVTVGMVRSERGITGVTIGCYRLKAPVISGANVSVLWTESTELTGVTVAGYNRTFGVQRGLVIGIFNHTESLLGVQIGLLNYAENNPSWARILPFINANF